MSIASIALARHGSCWIFCAFFCAALSLSPSVWAQDEGVLQEEGVLEEEAIDESMIDDLSEFSIEDLLSMEVTSVSRAKQKLSSAAAAVYVVTQEDIQRAGARSIPEALRMVPGIEVSQINTHSWAVSARGFNSIFASKMLVLIDGRTIYTPLYAGTFWDQQATPVENIERIEVIRGPGATLWGANAVNGIINIITKSAAESDGAHLKTVVGTDGVEGYARFGTQLGEDTHLKIFGHYFDRDGFVDAAGDDSHNDWKMGQLGFRLDSLLSQHDELTIQGDFSRGEPQAQTLRADVLSPTFTTLLREDISYVSGNLLGRWRREISDTQDLTLRVYFDTAKRDEVVLANNTVRYTRSTFDIDFQHRFAIGDSHQIIWGLGYRNISDNFKAGIAVVRRQDARSYHVLNLFIQDEIKLIEDELKLTIGSKFSHNDFTGFEIQPTIKLIWDPNDEHTLWASASRAVETVSRGVNDFQFREPILLPPGAGAGGGLPPSVAAQDPESTVALAIELGYRWQPEKDLHFDFAFFFNDYDNLATPVVNIDVIGFQPYTRIGIETRAKGISFGAEMSVEWRPMPALRISASYSYINIEVQRDGTTTPKFDNAEGSSPNHRGVLRLLWDVTDELQFNTSLYVSDDIPAFNIDPQARLDLQVRWQATEELEFGLGVRNLLDRRRAEWRREIIRDTTLVERTAYLWLDFQF